MKVSIYSMIGLPSNSAANASTSSLNLPTTLKAARDPYFASGKGSSNLTDLGRYVGSVTMRNAKELNPIVPNAATLNKAVKDNMEAAIFGQKTAKEALDAMVAVWNANL